MGKNFQKSYVYIDGEFHGKGIYTYTTGEVLDGSFEHGVPIGNGVVTLTNGVKKKCHFEKGVIKYDE